MRVPAELVAFLQPDRSPFEREDGLHSVIAACFPADGRRDLTGPLLEYVDYELLSDDGFLKLRVTLRLSWWANGVIEDVLEQPLDLLSFCPDFGRPYPSPLVALDRGADEVIEHVTALVNDSTARARTKIVGASRGVTPADLVLDHG
jgi:hypothetical protein